MKTTTFRAEKGSVLHSDIFNRDLAVSLAAGGILTVILAFAVRSEFASFTQLSPWTIVLSVSLFGVLFIGLRAVVFKESLLEVNLSRESGMLTVSLRSPLRSRKQSVPLSKLRDIRLVRTTYEPEDTDGIEMVEKIALRRGTVMPGLGDREDIHAVRLDLRNREVPIFRTKKREEAETLMRRLKNYLRTPYCPHAQH